MLGFQGSVSQYHPVRAKGIAVVGLLCAAMTLLFYDTVASMVGIWWRSETFTHGFLIAPISVWLAWRLRYQLEGVPVRPFSPALIGVALAGGGWLLGGLGGVAAAQHLGFVLMLQCAIVAVIGLEAAKVLAFPIGFLLFAVPLGEFLMPVMIDRTADFTAAAVRASGIPLYREGNHFVIPSGNWSVVEACSGVRYLIASIMGGTLFAHLYYRSMSRKLALVAASVAVPVVANWIRAYMIIMIGHLSGNELAVGADHLIYGWVFFGVVITLLFWVASRWAESDLSPPRPAVPSAPRQQPAGGARPGMVAAGAVAVAALWPASALALDQQVKEGAPALAISGGVGGWAPAPEAQPELAPRMVGPRTTVVASFSDGQASVTLHVGFYRQQGDASEVANADNIVVRRDDPRFRIVRETAVTLPWNGAPVPVNLTTIADGNDRYDVVDFYWVDGRYTGRRSLAKLFVALSKLRGHGDDAARIVLISPYVYESQPGLAGIERFARSASSEVDRTLSAAAAHDLRQP